MLEELQVQRESFWEGEEKPEMWASSFPDSLVKGYLQRSLPRAWQVLNPPVTGPALPFRGPLKFSPILGADFLEIGRAHV